MEVVESKKMKYIPLPTELYSEIERLVKENRNLGYLSVPDFVRDAVRDKILEIRKPKIAENRRNGSFVDVDTDAEVEEVQQR